LEFLETNSAFGRLIRPEPPPNVRFGVQLQLSACKINGKWAATYNKVFGRRARAASLRDAAAGPPPQLGRVYQIGFKYRRHPQYLCQNERFLGDAAER
jgi:hypothetical protein